MQPLLSNIVALFFPKLCEACGVILKDFEEVICTKCRHELPVTNFHFDNSNAVKKILYGRVSLIHATALFYFRKKSNVQQLIHNLKYRGHEAIGEELGHWLGSELSTVDSYKTIDTIIPVPLHKTKFRKRGYNQVHKFGNAIAKALDAEFVSNVLIKTKATKTKVFKSRINRLGIDNKVFEIQNYSKLNGKHLLLVDDIITTGATVEACANVLKKIPNIKLSLATMAMAD